MRIFFSFFLPYIFLHIMLLFLQNDLLITDDFYYILYGEKFTPGQIDDLIEQQISFGWVIYILFPFISLIKIFLVASCLMVYSFLANKEVSYLNMMITASKAEYVSLFLPATSLVWFAIINSNYTARELSNFSPFSALQLVEVSNVEPWLKYLLQSASLLEVLYILALAYFLRKELDIAYPQSVKVVTIFYGSSFVLWTLLMVFLILNFS